MCIGYPDLLVILPDLSLFTTGKKGLLMMFFSGICAAWKVGLLLMRTQSLFRVGTRRYCFLVAMVSWFVDIVQ
jgi:hypothetical protein